MMCFRVLAIPGIAACGDMQPPQADHDAAVDAATLDTATNHLDGPTAFLPLHVLPAALISGAPDLILGLTAGASPSIIDTSTLTIDGATNPYFVRQGNYAVLFAGTFAVQGLVAIQGTSPLIVVASDQVRVTADINLGATGRVAGPGAASTGAGGAGASRLGPSVRASSGGGGGSYGTVGAEGGTNNATYIPAGPGGARYGMSPDDPLMGGSRGGDGGFAGAGFIGAGGGGGGALQISSAVSISVLAKINAGGGGGTGGGVGSVGGGGGGAGGEILLESPTITIRGTLAANGGGGGGGGSGDAGPVGTAGQDGAAVLGPAMGGTGGIPQGSDGGTGAAGLSGSFAEAHPGDGFNSKGGGGGGGAGRIWLRYRAAIPPDLTGASLTPPAGMDPMLL